MRIAIALIMFAGLLSGCADPAPEPLDIEEGVSLELARRRKDLLSDITYRVAFSIPAQKEDPIGGKINIRFNLAVGGRQVALDFRAPADYLQAVRINGLPLEEAAIDKGHIVLPADRLQAGVNSVDIDFRAGDLSLNRSDDYLYTLFVPDRASTAFPCFDQPDLKAVYQLELEVPAEWEAVGNGPQESLTEEGDRKRYRFGPTRPISTYLFAFAAGRFQKTTQEVRGRSMTMFYRETDTEKVALNRDTIFGLHQAAIEWLEDYTGIAMPFQKFDFVLIPGFQYGGMEHVGNIFYRESSLFLDENASENRKLGRARLIAHETAHMWFGDLVTMRWFDDVWMKEVFANFMAAKVVNPGFPEINHELSFLLSHHPAAYSEDRSAGSHPIRQELENLLYAGTLYGRIIYQKAPVVMRQLETLMGDTVFRNGLREYLAAFSYSNATWDDLISILDRRSPLDLAEWSQVWVKEPGMPEIRTSLETADGYINQLTYRQEKASPAGNFWIQHTEAILFYPDSAAAIPVAIGGETTRITAAEGATAPLAILPNASAIGYGYFALDSLSRNWLLSNLPGVTDPVVRGAGWLALYEEFLRGHIPAAAFFAAVLPALEKEAEPLNRSNLLGYAGTVFWRFFSPDERLANAPALEALLWERLQQADSRSDKATFFNTFQNIALTDDGVQKLQDIWEGRLQVRGLTLSENDRIDLAAELALRLPNQANDILARQYDAIRNPDSKKRFAFVRPALSPDKSVRDTFFDSLKLPQNRHYEPWVGSALSYLHHPLRQEEALGYIRPSLELMEEIQATGDIFFPRQWITASLSGHQSPEAAGIVRTFLADRPDYPYRLRNKILMGADMLFRASRVPD